MSGRSPAGPLMHEHRIIERMVAILGREADILFRRLGEKDVDAALAEEMAGLIEDHVRSRGMTQQMIEGNRRYAAGDAAGLAEIDRAARGLIELYPVHIQKEDRHFFKRCLEHFTDAEKAEMLREYDEFDRTLIHEKYVAVVEALE